MADTSDQSIDLDRLPGRHERNCGAILLIGGPGQGKSTLGQLACQLHRSTLLMPYSKDLSSRERDVLTSFEQTVNPKPSHYELVRPDFPFLPLHVALPDLAAWLVKDHSDTGSIKSIPAIIKFIASLPSERKCELSADTILKFAGHLPYLLVFDGFDEVGATADRQRIGYAGELADIGLRLQTWHLLPLEREDAMVYARKLVEAKIGGVDAQKKTIERLEEAAKKPSTARNSHQVTKHWCQSR